MSADGLVVRHLRPVTAHEPRERDLICIRHRGCVNDPPAPVLKGLGADSICGPVLLSRNHKGRSRTIDSSLAGTLTSSRWLLTCRHAGRLAKRNLEPASWPCLRRVLTRLEPHCCSSGGPTFRRFASSQPLSHNSRSSESSG